MKLFSYKFLIFCLFIFLFTQKVKASIIDTNQINNLNQLFRTIIYNNPDSAFTICNEAISKSKKIDFVKGQAFGYNNLGFYYFSMGDFKNAYQNFIIALEIFFRINHIQGKASCLNNLGLMYMNQGSYKNALQCFFNVLLITEDFVDKTPSAKTLNNIGNIYAFQGNETAAINYYKKSLVLFKQTNDSASIAGSYNNIGLILKKRKQLDSALFYFKEGIVISQKINNLNTLSEALNNAGLIYYDKKNNKLALEFLLKSFEIDKLLGRQNGSATSLINIGNLFISEYKLEEAEQYYRKALEISNLIGDNECKRYAYEGLSNISFQRKNFEDAYFNLKKYNFLKDSILSAEINRNLAEIQTKYQIENKNKEIALLIKEREVKDLKIRKDQYKIWLISIILLAFFALLIVLLYAYHHKQKSVHLLNVQNTEITLQKEEIMVQKEHLEQLNYDLLQKQEEILAQKDEIQQKNDFLNNAKNIIEAKNKDITNSIKYALRIQKAMLPTEQQFKNYFTHSFIYFQPKDIVSGDFYWVLEKENNIIFAAVDCTGHGVPGAFMSIIGNNLLKQAVNEFKLYKPDEILNFLFFEIKKTLTLSGLNNEIGDGMDIALCSYRKDNKILQFSGVLMPLIIVRNNEIIEHKSDGYPIDINAKISFASYKNISIEVKPADRIYLLSDGYTDQFNHLDDKKFTMKRFKEMLLQIQNLDMSSQKDYIQNSFSLWKGNKEQIDDVMVLGIEID